MPNALSCKARVIWRKAGLLESQSPGVECAHLPAWHLRPGPSAWGDSEFRRLNPPGRRTTGSELVQGDGRDAYVTLDTSSARGIRDGLRGASPMATEGP
jgi:hypothetical protein